MKSYTDIEQSKKLAEMLPIESADMFYSYNVGVERYYGDVPRIVQVNNHFTFFHYDIPCWSLAALLDNIPQVKLDSTKQYDKKLWTCYAYFASNWHDSDWYDNPVDACYELILKLNELKML